LLNQNNNNIIRAPQIFKSHPEKYLKDFLKKLNKTITPEDSKNTKNQRSLRKKPLTSRMNRHSIKLYKTMVPRDPLFSTFSSLTNRESKIGNCKKFKIPTVKYRPLLTRKTLKEWRRSI